MGWALIIYSVATGAVQHRMDHVYETLTYCEIDAAAVAQSDQYYGRCFPALTSSFPVPDVSDAFEKGGCDEPIH